MSPAVASLYRRRKDCDAEREPYFSLLRANGCTPKYVMKTVKERKGRTALLTRECQERLNKRAQKNRADSKRAMLGSDSGPRGQ